MSEISDAVWMSYLRGNTDIKALAEEYGVCRERVRQLVAKKEREFKLAKRPFPCVRDEHGAIARQNIKRLFAKINEELDELKSEVDGWRWYIATDARTQEKESEWKGSIAEEAADTITAIVTLCEALGIDENMRDEAQRRVNEKNRKRGRL